MTIKTIREMIERLEWVEQAVKGTPHPNTDLLDIRIHFGDAELDNRYWDVTIDEIDFNNRPGCGCEENALILLAVKDITLK